MALPELLEGQQNPPNPHADLFSRVMVNNIFHLLAPNWTKTPDEDLRCH